MVEDEVHDATIVQHALRQGGFRFTFHRVDNELSFLKELDSFKPSVILSDHGLPSFDGFSALALAREKAPDTPFIFVTGSLGEEMTARALKSGASDFILKHRLSGLPPAIHRALRQADADARRRQAENQIRRLNLDLERRVQERTTELESANKELEAFSFSVSHDLRAPLRHIEGFVEILTTTKSALLDEEARRYLDTISQSARQMGHLIDDLLSFSRTARADLRKSPVRLGQVVEASIRELQQEIGDRTIQWQIARLPRVEGDPALLHQVMVNLLGNALKYTRPRSPARIEVGWIDQPGEQIIYVKDNGVGFDMRYVDKLFGVFQRLHRAAEFEGTGIGLANVRRIVHRHGGRAWAEAELDKGASFYFSLPKLAPERRPSKRKQSKATKSAPDDIKNPERPQPGV